MDAEKIIEKMAREYVDAEAKSMEMPDGMFSFDSWPAETQQHAIAEARAAFIVAARELAGVADEKDMQDEIDNGAAMTGAAAMVADALRALAEQVEKSNG